ncbi:sugar ABC transporter ATP-binding protein [Rhodococcoides kyotonense]|uniref:Ribose transport system ATP-binding protein n=1 Tax=Rhodococcoides kyotonense TaxID=398843 RepID=A0A239K248_9NOCA|nr:sugar ABC transporter ATP-binding protein [Rhodococcus kyotonensis]SNT12447.1 ribose transport system ATP-binding protein [Rhodococcus kyotonensis]
MSVRVSETQRTDVPWLEVSGISKNYGGVHALREANLTIGAGTVHGLVGPNGAGKSTLVKILAGIERPDTGVMRIDGTETILRSPSVAQQHRLVLMPQEISLIPDSNLVDNIVLGSEPTRLGFRMRKQARARASAALEMVGLELALDTRAGDLATVHKRLLMLARAAAERDARLLILDEPTAGLEANEADMVTGTVRRLAAAGVTVVYISHHLTEVAELCDRVTGVREGRTVETLVGSDVAKAELVRLVLGVSKANTDGSVESMHAPTAYRSGDRESIHLDDVCGTRLRNVTVTARSGSVTGITGLLGSGVVELVSVLAGSTAPRSGVVRIDGRQVRLKTPADALALGVGYLAGDRTAAAMTEMTVRENVALAATARLSRWGIISKRREKAECDSVTDRLKVEAGSEAVMSSLSGGNQQRALVGRLIAADVDVLVLDEPTVGVDIHAREALWKAITDVAVDKCVIVASTDPDELVALCDRVVCLLHGEVAAILEKNEISVSAITAAVT